MNFRTGDVAGGTTYCSSGTGGGLAMTVTLEERQQWLLGKLGVAVLPTLLEDVEALVSQAVACLKTDSGFQLVSPPKGASKNIRRGPAAQSASSAALARSMEPTVRAVEPRRQLATPPQSAVSSWTRSSS